MIGSGNPDPRRPRRDHAGDVACASKDIQFRDHIVTESRVETTADDGDDGGVTEQFYEVSLKEGYCLYVRDEHHVAPAPRPGDILRLFGKGLGYPVRGIALLGPHGGAIVRVTHVYRYRTAEEEAADRREETARAVAARAAKWAARTEETAREVAALPGPFRERFEFFSRRPSWGPEFGPYEIFTMQEAVKIAGVKVDGVAGAAAVAAFARLGPKEQRALLPSLSDEHSGNTFASACRLAHTYLTEPALVRKMHGALCPLVGCAEYGCWSQTLEAAEERE